MAAAQPGRVTHFDEPLEGTFTTVPRQGLHQGAAEDLRHQLRVSLCLSTRSPHSHCPRPTSTTTGAKCSFHLPCRQLSPRSRSCRGARRQAGSQRCVSSSLRLLASWPQAKRRGLATPASSATCRAFSSFNVTRTVISRRLGAASRTRVCLAGPAVSGSRTPHTLSRRLAQPHPASSAHHPQPHHAWQRGVRSQLCL